MFRLLPLALLMFGSFAANSQSSYQVSGLVKPKLSSNWQQRFLDLFAASDKNEALALLSYSGYGDDGQVVLLTGKTGSEIHQAEPNSDRIANITPLTGAQVDSLLTAAKDLASKGDLETGAFDGKQYELIHARKSGSTLTIEERTYMNNPGIVPDASHKPYLALIGAFHSLVATPTPKPRGK